MFCLVILIKVWGSSFSAFSAIFVFQTTVLANTCVSVHASSSLSRMCVWVFPAAMAAFGNLRLLNVLNRTVVFSLRCCGGFVRLKHFCSWWWSTHYTPEDGTVDSQQAGGEKSIQIQTETLIWVSLQGIHGFFPFIRPVSWYAFLSPKLCAI